MDENKKTRKKNWEAMEKTMLVQLVGNRIDIIEKKKNNYQANSAKVAAWEEIHREFRARYGDRRTLKDLREQWKRVKLSGKAEWAEYSKKRRMTGGGEPPQQPSDLSVLLRDMVPGEFAQMINEYDDDAEIARRNDDAVSAFEYLAGMLPGTETSMESPVNLSSNRCDDSISIEMAESTETIPEGIMFPPIATHSKEATPVKRNSQAKRRVSTPSPATTSTQSPSLEETLKLHAVEEHRLKMKNLEEEQKIKLSYLEEQQKLKMEILQLEKKVQQRKLDPTQNQQDGN